MGLETIITDLGAQITAIVTSLIGIISVIASGIYIIRKVRKGFGKRKSWTLTQAELENLINDSLQIQSSNETFFEKRILLAVEIQNQPLKRMNAQKVIIQNEMQSALIFIKDTFTDFIKKVCDLDPSLYYEQNFNNAVELVLLEVRRHLYDMCEKNIWKFDDDSWAQDIENKKKEFFSLFKQELLRRYKQYYIMSQNGNKSFDNLLNELEIIMNRHITIALTGSRKEAEQTKRKIASLVDEKAQLCKKSDQLKKEYREQVLQKYMNEKLDEEELLSENLKLK